MLSPDADSGHNGDGDTRLVSQGQRCQSLPIQARDLRLDPDHVIVVAFYASSRAGLVFSPATDGGI